MSEQPHPAIEDHSVRLDTLIRIRWVAVIGQTVAVVFVSYGMDFELPLALCLVAIAFSAWLNVVLRWRYGPGYRLGETTTSLLLGYDIVQLAALLFLTGGLQNPFALLLVVPVVISATSQSIWQTVMLGTLATACATALTFYHLPLPWYPGTALQIPLLLLVGTWSAIVSSLIFTAVYAFRVADEGRKLSAALSATELALQREQHISALDGLAAAAAHELGTPLATIALVSKELSRELKADSPHQEDAKLLLSQAARCREILQKLTSLSSEGADAIAKVPLASLMEEVAGPHRDFGIALSVSTSAGGQAALPEPVMVRNPAILYGLGNLLENAVDFARSAVEFDAYWNEETVVVEISDDGPGFSREILDRIGEPYVTTRTPDRSGGGLGLGLFIAKSLLERTGAALTFENRTDGPKAGARVRVKWPQAALKQWLAELDTRAVANN